MNVLVTGGGGWVGRYCVASLAEAGHHVVTLGRTARGAPGGARHISADLRAPTGLAGALAGLNVERVIHLAGETGRGVGAADLPTFWEGNVQATLNLFDALEPSCSGAVIISSAAVYGSAGAPGGRTHETARLEPVSWYGVSKAAQEHVAAIAGRNSGIPVDIVRIFNLIGPDGPPLTVAYDIAQRLVGQHRRGDPLEVESPRTIRDFVDVRDAVEAIRLLLGRLPGDGDAPIWNVCSGRETSVQELAELIRARIPGAQPLRFRPLDPSPGNVVYQVGDSTALQAGTAWKPRRELEESVGELVAHVLDSLRQVPASAHGRGAPAHDDE